MALGLLIGLGLALAPEASASPVVVPPYKVDKHWSYFRNQDNCSAAAIQPSNNAILLMAYDDREKAFSITFSTDRTSAMNEGDQRVFDLRLHRPAGVLDDGWEGVTFTVSTMIGSYAMMTSQWLDIPASRDFAEMNAVDFIAHGRSAGYFRMRNPNLAVKEMIRCARAISRKP